MIAFGDYKTIVVHVPHASTEVPEDVRKDFVLTDDELQRELLRITDHYTDELFGLEDERVTIVRYPVSRLVCDPERFRDDDRETLAKIGIGAVYKNTSQLKPLRRERCAIDREQVLARYYDPHHQRLEEAVDRGLERGPVLIIDAHSFPKVPLRFEPDPDGPREAVCLGTDPFHTPPSVLGEVRARFEHLGYAVSVDRPFKGSIVPLKHYEKTKDVASIMIELRRDIYMDEATGARTDGFDRVREHVGRVILAKRGPRRLQTLAEVVSPEVLEEFIKSRPSGQSRSLKHLFPGVVGYTSITFHGGGRRIAEAEEPEEKD